jgi:phosphoribosyl-AMP cyclohydrolase / phosphoribosyl-ATP pyrophosphohydrolase
MTLTIDDVRFDNDGLAPCVVQDADTLGVLMLAYMNAESLKTTLETKETCFWSRSRKQLWHKGETSGSKQRVVNVLLDCDSDAVLVRVKPDGPACHTGKTSCFHNVIQGQEPAGLQSNSRFDSSKDLGQVLGSLYALIEARNRERPEGSYTAYLFNEGLDKILKKVGEESSETIIAAKNEDKGGLARESCDLLYHLLVLLVEQGVTLTELRDELVRRERG